MALRAGFHLLCKPFLLKRTLRGGETLVQPQHGLDQRDDLIVRRLFDGVVELNCTDWNSRNIKNCNLGE
ncbi:hypothetical protein EMGBD1_23350 [Anaerolineaceae bacterium]|nr:hypothetical protein EMGBD1_23350 [Anaerolineaceae bacterium]